MARDFVAANAEFLQATTLGAIPAAPPFSYACWFDTDSTASTVLLMGIFDAGTTDNLLEMTISSSATLRVRARGGGSAEGGSTLNTYGTTRWHAACGIFAAANDRVAVLDGDWDNRGTNGVSVTPTGIDNFCIGRRGDSTPNAEYDGRLAMAATWDIALSREDTEAWAAGFIPRPYDLTNLWLLREPSGNAFDIIGGDTLTDNNTVGAGTDDPPIIGAMPILVRGQAAVVGGGSTPRMALMGVG